MAPDEIAGPRYRGFGISKWARAGVLGERAGKSITNDSTVPFPGTLCFLAAHAGQSNEERTTYPREARAWISITSRELKWVTKR